VGSDPVADDFVDFPLVSIYYKLAVPFSISYCMKGIIYRLIKANVKDV
jgi:hypothetical protein